MSTPDLYAAELVLFTDPDLQQLTLGALPAIGRYFTAPCTLVSPGVFRVRVRVPRGDLYYHGYSDDGLANVILDCQNIQVGAKNWHSIARIGSHGARPVHFECSPSFVSRLASGDVEVKLRTCLGGLVAARLVLCIGARPLELTMELVYRGGDWCFCRAIIPSELVPATTGLAFSLRVQDEDYYVGASDGFARTLDGVAWFDIAGVCAQLVEPAGPGDGCVYHVFPDRFRRSGQIATERALTAWGEPPQASSLYGGDLPGIIASLDHIQSLGARYLYLTPIFAADSSHRYDCHDFHTIDPVLGSPDDFQRLVTEAHARDIRVVLDIVLNHCGVKFWAFRDLLEHQERSRYKDWFIVRQFPVEVRPFAPGYQCWWNLGSMPEFNLENAELREYLFEVCAHWVRTYDVDAWRIDVSSELPPALLAELRGRLQRLGKDVLVIGENWKDASPFFDRCSGLSGVTNYRYWWELLVPFLADRSLSVSGFALKLMDIVFQYPHERLLSCWNIIGSHDIPRLPSLVDDPQLLGFAVALQFFLPGLPVVYYGDEIGLPGDDDPDNRRCMPWDPARWDHALLSWHRELAVLRRQLPALQRGMLSVAIADDARGLLVLRRRCEHHEVALVLNTSDRALELAAADRSLLPAACRDELTGARVTSTIQLAPRSLKILGGATP
jgi:cyclomaltodextrinase / maltogenic alpha-amylase / neopullulanase